MDGTQIITTLRSVVDPEIGINIVDLGLIYNVEWDTDQIHITMTMTSPTCPLGEMILNDVYVKLRRSFPQVQDIQLDLVWDPPWSPGRMSAVAKAQLGWDR